MTSIESSGPCIFNVTSSTAIPWHPSVERIELRNRSRLVRCTGRCLERNSQPGLPDFFHAFRMISRFLRHVYLCLSCYLAFDLKYCGWSIEVQKRCFQTESPTVVHHGGFHNIAQLISLDGTSMEVKCYNDSCIRLISPAKDVPRIPISSDESLCVIFGICLCALAVRQTLTLKIGKSILDSTQTMIWSQNARFG